MLKHTHKIRYAYAINIIFLVARERVFHWILATETKKGEKNAVRSMVSMLCIMYSGVRNDTAGIANATNLNTRKKTEITCVKA